jgi:hypothetical protein
VGLTPRVARLIVLVLGFVFLLNTLDPTPRFLGFPRPEENHPATPSGPEGSTATAQALPFELPVAAHTVARRGESLRTLLGVTPSTSTPVVVLDAAPARAPRLSSDASSSLAIDRLPPLRC